MPRSAVFFDRDNTLIINDGYLGDPEKTVLMPGAALAVAAANAMGFAVITISNQSGVARGLFDEAAVQTVDARMDAMLRADNANARIDLHLYCPFHPQAAVMAYRKESNLRKPAPGMILVAAKQLNLNLATSWVIGDGIRDIEAGIAAGCRTILFVPEDIPASPAALADKKVLSDYTVDRLSKALDVIAAEIAAAKTPNAEQGK